MYNSGSSIFYGIWHISVQYVKKLPHTWQGKSNNFVIGKGRNKAVSFGVLCMHAQKYDSSFRSPFPSLNVQKRFTMVSRPTCLCQPPGDTRGLLCLICHALQLGKEIHQQLSGNSAFTMCPCVSFWRFTKLHRELNDILSHRIIKKGLN